MGFLHILCIIMSIFVFPVYAHMLRQIKDDNQVSGHIVFLTVFLFLFVSIVLRNMY